MPRIAARTECYDTLRECMRHYKAKRDHLLHHLGKTSYIDGSQFVIAFISPKGEIDTFQSTLLKESPPTKGEKGAIEGAGVLNMDVLKRHASTLKHVLKKRREEEGKATRKTTMPGPSHQSTNVGSDEDDVDADDGQDEGDEEDAEEIDADKTLVDEHPPTPLLESGTTKPSSSEPKLVPEHCLILPPDGINPYFEKRFADVHQDTCKIVTKAWIKVVEPKKQSKYPYNKGDSAKPKWWPANVDHRAPDHISKEQRIALLIHILTSGIIKVCELELATASAMVWIPFEKMEMMREICTVGRVLEQWRQAGDKTKDLVVPIPPSLRRLVGVPVKAESPKPAYVAPALPRKRSRSPLSISTKFNIPHNAKHSKQHHSEFTSFSPLQVGEFAWRPSSAVNTHHMGYTPLGFHMGDQQNSPMPHSPLNPQHQYQPQYSHPQPMHLGHPSFALTRHHSMYEATEMRSPAFMSMVSPSFDSFRQQGSGSSFMYVNTPPPLTSSHSAPGPSSHDALSPHPINPTSAPLSATLSEPLPNSVSTPASAPPHLSQPAPLASTPASTEFVRSASAQGYMQQQQIEYLQNHRPQEYGFVQPVQAPAGVVNPEGQGYMRYEFEGEGEYDYGMPAINDQGY